MKKASLYFFALIGLALATGCASNKPQPLSQAYPQNPTPVGSQQPATEYAGDDVYNQGQPMPVDHQYANAQYSQQYQQSAPQYFQDQSGNTFYYGQNGAMIYVSMGVSVGSQSQNYPPQNYPPANQYTQPINNTGRYITADPNGTAGGMDGSRQLAEANYMVAMENYQYANSQTQYTYDQWGNPTGTVAPQDPNGIYAPRDHVGQRNGNPAVNPNQNIGYQNSGYQKIGNVNKVNMGNSKMRPSTDQRHVQQNIPNQKVQTQGRIIPKSNVVNQNNNVRQNNNSNQPRKLQ
ncbi:MAG TPA: hypothetical protein PK950_01910 [Candidatus Paceibacterota bacterium]|nr:hypothetical protein [Candidatus Paceibacterota bacterium]